MLIFVVSKRFQIASQKPSQCTCLFSLVLSSGKILSSGSSNSLWGLLLWSKVSVKHPSLSLSISNITSFSNPTHLDGSELLKELHSWKQHPLKSLGNSGDVVWGSLCHYFMFWAFLVSLILCSWLVVTYWSTCSLFSLIIKCNFI